MHRDDALHADAVQAALAEVIAVPDRPSLAALARRLPLIIDDTFLVAAQAALAEATGQTAAVLRERLQWLSEIQRGAEQDVPAALEALAAARDMEDLRNLVDRWPWVVTGSFVEMIDQLAQQLFDAGERDAASSLRQRLVGLAQLRAQRESWIESPQARAVFAFLNAEDDAAALAAFQTHRELLSHAEAQRTLDDVLQGGDPESQQRLERRRELLRYLRGEEQSR
ncbi:MAG: hypothetical protein HXY39_06510 [Chloroflexi bacterium]|nr:hypothetical protein [Chloroflexota bacterium]